MFDEEGKGRVMGLQVITMTLRAENLVKEAFSKVYKE